VTDHQVMEAVREGRVEQLAILFERHHVSLYNFFLRMTGNPAASEDLVQDVFIRILKYRTTYQGEDKFVVWMYKIGRNAHIDYLRKRKSVLALEDGEMEAVATGPGPEEAVERDREAALVTRAMAQLSPKKQEILVLSRFQNLKYREIADLLDCPVGTVKGMVHRAVEELGEIYHRMTAVSVHPEECRHEV
jgi:RNA polymerase sigma factor (sigma-70 family)